MSSKKRNLSASFNAVGSSSGSLSGSRPSSAKAGQSSSSRAGKSSARSTTSVVRNGLVVYLYVLLLVVFVYRLLKRGKCTLTTKENYVQYYKLLLIV